MTPSDLDLLATNLQTKSISDREIVLLLADVLPAIDQLVAQGVAVFAWEGWILTPDGKSGHAYWPMRFPDGEVLPSIVHMWEVLPQAHQEWPDYITRVAAEARITIVEAQNLWDADPGWSGATLHFCLSVAKQDDSPAFSVAGRGR
jgi:hypothetical protein